MTRAIVVTGAAGGIGTAPCKRMRQEGYVTIGIDREPALEADVDMKIDLRNTEDLVGLGYELAENYELKAIVHNAAVQPIAIAGETSLRLDRNPASQRGRGRRTAVGRQRITCRQ